MATPIIEILPHVPVAQQRVGVVERKGVGHPDMICGAILEQVSLALCESYLLRFGRILHHNLDKGLLVAGRSEPRLGGGQRGQQRISRPVSLTWEQLERLVHDVERIYARDAEVEL